MRQLNIGQLTTEFDRQVTNLLDMQYPHAARISTAEFLKYIKPLRNKLEKVTALQVDIESGKIPFVIVVTNELIPSEKMMSVINRDGKHGVTILRPHTTQNFTVITDITIPNSNAYLLVDIDRGKGNRNIPPCDAMLAIKKENRSPLTIDEGIAVTTQYPEFLMKNNCFSLLASRTGTDKRVPAIWINAKQEPNLGWCWDGNPHTWLGSASCRERVG